ncbi:hypothetical protein HYPSUDRAFT_59304 [Hypholoma sublateritium FD-334 SS-4]|uniref:Uncharacterized protein n=1 Tax=Hypholoma sublateritium (strain FD-334 SS-4) TaxID=945553 RepID=A0A0D2KIS1_HYPSF|nr:hypothetical protein HYPSUDRAFT_59304 [Hypholoma sublateritium FD-334 SS-4]
MGHIDDVLCHMTDRSIIPAALEMNLDGHKFEHPVVLPARTTLKMLSILGGKPHSLPCPHFVLFQHNGSLQIQLYGHLGMLLEAGCPIYCQVPQPLQELQNTHGRDPVVAGQIPNATAPAVNGPAKEDSGHRGGARADGGNVPINEDPNENGLFQKRFNKIRANRLFFAARQPYKEPAGRHDLGLMNIECPDCGALHWAAEKLTKSTKEAKFGLCCLSGKVKLPAYDDPPQPLLSLLTSQERPAAKFRENIWSYNRSLAFTSLGVTHYPMFKA